MVSERYAQKCMVFKRFSRATKLSGRSLAAEYLGTAPKLLIVPVFLLGTCSSDPENLAVSCSYVRYSCICTARYYSEPGLCARRIGLTWRIQLWHAPLVKHSASTGSTKKSFSGCGGLSWQPHSANTLEDGFSKRVLAPNQL